MGRRNWRTSATRRGRRHSTPTVPKPRPTRGSTHFRRRPAAAGDAADCGWESGFLFPADGNVVVHADVLDDQELAGTVVQSMDVVGGLRPDGAALAGFEDMEIGRAHV